jgi:hypothetical protein
MILVGGVMIMLDYYQTTHVLVMLIPSISFFITHYFLLIRKAWLSELLFLFMVVYLVLQNFLISYEKLNVSGWLRIEAQRYQPVELPIKLEDKKILVLGKHTGEYYRNDLATPYLSWEIAQKHINEMESYEDVIKVYHHFASDPPEVLIDKNEWAAQIFNKIPQLSLRYKKLNDQIYLLL